MCIRDSAYGEKENGAVFSHMTVMYANALYQRGFVKEGYRAVSYTHLDVTFFYGNKRIMTSALDKKGNRILGSEAG